MLSDQLETPLEEDLIKNQIESNWMNLIKNLYTKWTLQFKRGKETKFKRLLKLAVNPKIERKKYKKKSNEIFLSESTNVKRNPEIQQNNDVKRFI